MISEVLNECRTATCGATTFLLLLLLLLQLLLLLLLLILWSAGIAEAVVVGNVEEDGEEIAREKEDVSSGIHACSATATVDATSSLPVACVIDRLLLALLDEFVFIVRSGICAVFRV